MSAFISNVHIENFRNFKSLDVDLTSKAVFVGENKVGKSNLLYALRLILDPELPDSARYLSEDDFWDGLKPEEKENATILISISIKGFKENEKLLAILADYITEVDGDEPIATITYKFFKNNNDDNSEFNFVIYGGNDEANFFGYYERKWMPLQVLPALRDGERDLESWKNSPLKPLVNNLDVNEDDLEKTAALIDQATDGILQISEVSSLNKNINNRITNMIGEQHSVSPSLGFVPTNGVSLLKSLRLYVDGAAKRNISSASLGICNILYLTLLLLELERKEATGERATTFLAIEEPEAHLHPHLQRLVYRDFLGRSNCVLLTTHSPHIASVSPVDSLVSMANLSNNTVANSTAKNNFTIKEMNDLARYLDTTRAEILFTKKVILVEGDSELYLIPECAKLLDSPLDQLGVTVCSVHGTDFLPYVKLLAKNSLNIQHKIITDADPVYDEQGEVKSYRVYNRARKILEITNNKTLKQFDSLLEDENYDELDKLLSENDIYINDNTLEVELIEAGNLDLMKKTLSELGLSSTVCDRFEEHGKKVNERLSAKKVVKYIERVGKGRFAQHFCSYLIKENIPEYIKSPISELAIEQFL